MHHIQRYQTEDKTIPYRPVRNYLWRSLAALIAGSVVTAAGGVTVIDYMSGWPETCNGNPMPAWPGVVGFFLLIVAGFITAKKVLSIATIFEPFANGAALDARGQKKAKPQSDLDQAAEEFKARTEPAKSTVVDRDDNVIEADWISHGEMPA